MAYKRKTLPKNIDELLASARLDELTGLFKGRRLGATGGYHQQTVLAYDECTDEFVAWYLAQGGDLEAPDRSGRTPLHTRAGSWRESTGQLLELGANPNARDAGGNAPLHAAAMAPRVGTLRLLLAHGADPQALSESGDTALDLVLRYASNATLDRAAPAARLLLEAGADRTESHREAVRRLGETFELHRAEFARELLDDADAALSELYALFDVEAVPAHVPLAPDAPIPVQEGSAGARHAALWDLLVPSMGPAGTVQGELIRTTGRLANEILGNGGINWDAGFVAMLKWSVEQLGRGEALGDAEREEAAGLQRAMHRGSYSGAEVPEPQRLQTLAVHWVELNPVQRANDAPNFGR